MARYLITGSSGFVAQHFISYLSENDKGSVVLGLDLASPELTQGSMPNLKIVYKKMDLSDSKKLQEEITKFKPKYVLHLASFSSVAKSWDDPAFAFENNVGIFLSLMEAIRKAKINCRILSVGSSEEYGNKNKLAMPLREDAVLSPESPYAAARVSQELISAFYFKGFGLDIVMTRSFNHLGPGQKDLFAIPSFAKQLLEIKQGKRAVLKVGNVEISRDWLDVRDVVRAYFLLLKRGKKGEVYNVCSGRTIKLKDVIARMAKMVGVKASLSINKKLIRPTDSKIMLGSNRKIVTAIGWRPQISLNQSLADVMNFWQDKMGKSDS